jgi:cytochrome c biogenesis protein CcmG/thiol:disulfide interchange protein DsbE
MSEAYRGRYLIAIVITALMILIAAPLQAAAPMPQFKLSAIAGDEIDSSSYRGQVVLINFFATWCPPCRQEIPLLVQVQKQFGAKGFSVIGISVDQGSSKIVKKFSDKMGINYPVGMGTERVTRDFGGVVGIPVSFLVDRHGNMVKSYQGYVEEEVLERDIKQLL